MKLKEIVAYLREVAPEFLQEDWDNSGLQVGDINQEIKKILVSLDVDRDVLNYSRENNIDLIISHHPMIFSGLKSIEKEDYLGGMIYDLINSNISVYSAHTNLDKVKNGVSYGFAKHLGLKEMEFLKSEDGEFGYGIVGLIERTTLNDFIGYLKGEKNIGDIRLYGNPLAEIERIGVCGGSGSDFIIDAHKKGLDLYITGDIKYHEAQYGAEFGLNIMDLGHYETEKYVLDIIRDNIIEKFQLEVEVWNKSSPSYNVY